jgi:HK97 family phage prohead protease
MDLGDAARAAGMITNPAGTERLHQYWVHGEGAAKIRWGEPGDFSRCVEHLRKYIRDPEGYCNLAHHSALGFYPATHAKLEKAGRSDMTTVTERADSPKPYGNVRYADPKNGKYPIDTEAHARAAWSYINMPKNAAQYPLNGVTLSEVKDRIRAACKGFGIDIGEESKAGASRADLDRDYPLEDMQIVRSADGGDGRTMEAFAAVFNTETGISDHEGEYLEVIDPAAFNKRVADLKRSRQGVAQVKVMFNHGRDLNGNPDVQLLMPVAVPVSIEATARGLLTRSRFVNTPRGEEVLELVKAGAVTAMSFTGRIIRSDPQLSRHGRRHRDSSGRLTTVRRLELGLREYGPVLFPAYEGAGINGVRMFTPSAWEPDDPDAALLPDGEAAAGEPPPDEGHSARYHEHALYVLRSKEAREQAGLTW